MAFRPMHHLIAAILTDAMRCHTLLRADIAETVTVIVIGMNSGRRNRHVRDHLSALVILLSADAVQVFDVTGRDTGGLVFVYGSALSIVGIDRHIRFAHSVYDTAADGILRLKARLHSSNIKPFCVLSQKNHPAC